MQSVCGGNLRTTGAHRTLVAYLCQITANGYCQKSRKCLPLQCILIEESDTSVAVVRQSKNLNCYVYVRKMAVLSGGWPLLFFAPRLRAEIAEADAHKAPRPTLTKPYGRTKQGQRRTKVALRRIDGGTNGQKMDVGQTEVAFFAGSVGRVSKRCCSFATTHGRCCPFSLRHTIIIYRL